MSEPRILIVRFSAIGDCVMVVPPVSMLRAAFPNAFIAWAIEPRCRDVVDTTRLVDLPFEIPRQEWKQQKTGWAAQLRHFALLRKFNFDYGFDLQGHFKTALCLRIARPKARLASKATDLVARALNPVFGGVRDPIHAVDDNIAVVRKLVGELSRSDPVMPELEKLPSLPQGVDRNRFITICVGAGSPEKTYPLERWKLLGSILLAHGYQVAFLGGPEDPSVSLQGALDWVGRLSLAGSMAAIACSRVHVAADTGTGHIAAAYGVPVVSVFGFTDRRRFEPYTPLKVVLDAGPRMDGLTPDAIAESVETLMRPHRYALFN